MNSAVGIERLAFQYVVADGIRFGIWGGGGRVDVIASALCGRTLSDDLSRSSDDRDGRNSSRRKLCRPSARGYNRIGFTSVFLGTAVLIVSGYILITLFTKDTPPRQTHGQDEDLHRPLRAFIHIVQTHRKIFLNVGSATVLLQFIRAGRILLIPLWGEYIGLSTAQIGLAISLSSIVDAGLFYVAGYLMDHWGRKWSSVPTMILLALSLGLLPFSYSHTLFVITVLISGVGNGFGTGIVMTLGADYSPAKNRGEFLGAWRFLGDSGSAIGPFVIGLAAETFLLSGALWFTAGVGVLGAVVFAWGTQETLRRRPY